MKGKGPVSPTKKNYNRNRSFGGSGGPPVGPKKGNQQPARRSVSHDAQTIRKQFAEAEGFNVIGEKRKGGGGGPGGKGSDKAPIVPPRGRVNPTSSFTRPRNTSSFSKNRPDNQQSQANGRTRSFNRPRPAGSFNSNASSKKDYKRTNSRLTSRDVELYQSGDGFNRAQRDIVRITQDDFLQARLLYMDPPDFGKSDSNWSPHPKCLWNDPTRRDQIEQVMMKYPNAIPLSMKKRTRIVSSKLGDAALTNSNSDDASYSACDDASSLGASTLSFSERLGSSERIGQSERTGPGDRTSDTATIDESFSFGMGGQEDMNPLRKTLLLLNKLSWTTIDRLTPKLFEVLEKDVPKMMKSTTAPPTTILTPAIVSASVDGSKENESDASKQETEPGKDSNHSQKSQKQEEEISPMTVTILTLIVEKAQTEPHFSAMYAQLCKNLADRNKIWKRKILAHCQSEFEHDIAYHTKKLDERLVGSSSGDMDKSSNTNATSENDRDYLVLQLRQKYLGHVQFIGELFKLKLIKLDIMIWCLSRLLFSKDHVDEDDLDCFARLMTTVGAQAESLVKKGKCHAMAEEKWHQCWDRVYFLTGRKKKQSKQNVATEQKEDGKPPKIGSRIKYMLVDLLELEENGWVHRRTKEKPKTIAEIHKEVREEEAQARRRSNSDDFFNRGRSNSNDSFTMSPQYMSRKVPKKIDADGFSVVPKKNTIVRRAVSDVEVSDIYNKDKRSNSLAVKKHAAAPESPSSRSRTIISQMDAEHSTPKIVEYPDPQECKEKTKILLKEYFVGGDAEEAIRCIDELVGAGTDTDGHSSVDRGAAVIETGVLLVLEMKQQEVQKFLAVMKRCLQKKKIEKECLALGLNDPLEFLNDIEIDAPLARSLLTNIVSYWVRQGVMPLAFLLEAPEYFRTDGKAAEFAASVVKMRGGEASDEDLAVIEKLMTDDDKKKYSSAKDLLGPQD